MRFLLRGTMAVCGIGSPIGWRNSAVTAHQSASPPPIAASAKARTKPIVGCTYRIYLAVTSVAANPIRKPVAPRRRYETRFGAIPPSPGGAEHGRRGEQG